ncbi:hypothetical protein [Sansalvadorimonas verongulae]|uniref:hypothetical protein n=1 Tax=Sansalvadorimonas verongulae TaxID=2172824 RepID=UPI0012BB6FF6|nr:hypothetical protein [Sansalvadorimonas verongulae]MTI15617.1 hypothetical protein [Sansalvadorimonas verongulae]
MLLIRNRLAKVVTRLFGYGLIAVLLTLYGVGKIKDSHEQMALSALQHIESGNDALFSLETPYISVLRTGAEADYYRSLASDQLGKYQAHTLVNWTVDLKYFLAHGSLPIELYYQSDYENGLAMHNMRLEGALAPELISQSIRIE